MKNILITGGAGFIGSALARRLRMSGHNVYALDNLHPQVHREPGRPQLLSEHVPLIMGDVTSAATWDGVLRLVRPDVIVHLAAETGTGQSLTEASRHGSVNVVGTTQMTDALTRAGFVPEHIILASSRAIYGDGEWRGAAGAFYPEPRTRAMLEAGRWGFDDSAGYPAAPLASRADHTHPRPSSIYAATKLTQEHILSAWTNAMGANLSILRLQNVYGPGQSLYNSYTGVVAFFAREASAGRALEIYEDGDIIRDFVYIEDVVNALELALNKPPRGRRVVDVGSGRKLTMRELAYAAAAVFGAPEPRVSGKFRDGDVRAAYCDISRTTEELGYRSEWTMEAGLRELARWLKETGA